MGFNQQISKLVETNSSRPAEATNDVFNLLAAELCSETPNKTKIKKLCEAGKILFSGDMIDLMSTVLFELSEIRKHKSK